MDRSTSSRSSTSWTVDYRTLPSDAYPNIAAIADHLPSLDDAANFELLVDLLIDSL